MSLEKVYLEGLMMPLTSLRISSLYVSDLNPIICVMTCFDSHSVCRTEVFLSTWKEVVLLPYVLASFRNIKSDHCIPSYLVMENSFLKPWFAKDKLLSFLVEMWIHLQRESFWVCSIMLVVVFLELLHILLRQTNSDIVLLLLAVAVLPWKSEVSVFRT